MEGPALNATRTAETRLGWPQRFGNTAVRGDGVPAKGDGKMGLAGVVMVVGWLAMMWIIGDMVYTVTRKD